MSDHPPSFAINAERLTLQGYAFLLAALFDDEPAEAVEWAAYCFTRSDRNMRFARMGE